MDSHTTGLQSCLTVDCLQSLELLVHGASLLDRAVDLTVGCVKGREVQVQAHLGALASRLGHCLAAKSHTALKVGPNYVAGVLHTGRRW